MGGRAHNLVTEPDAAADIRYERRDDVYNAFHQLGCALICFNFLQRTSRLW